MERLHLFEFEDQRWCPAVLRNAVTGYLRFAVTVTPQIRPVVPALAELLRQSGESSILDLCSGTGGIAHQLARGLARRGMPTRIVLSDLYPDTAAFAEVACASGGLVEFRRAPLDATAVPGELPGLRTIFNAFHLLRPREARRVLSAAAESGRPIAIVDFNSPTGVGCTPCFWSTSSTILTARVTSSAASILNGLRKFLHILLQHAITLNDHPEIVTQCNDKNANTQQRRISTTGARF